MHKWIMAALLLCSVALGIGTLFHIAATHQSGVQQAAPAPKLPEAPLDEAAATALFKQNCMACHGAELQGAVGPNLQKVGGKLTVEQIYTQIENGGGMMPPFKTKLKDDEAANLARWLAAKK